LQSVFFSAEETGTGIPAKMQACATTGDVNLYEILPATLEMSWKCSPKLTPKRFIASR